MDSDVVDVAAGRSHCVYLKADGTLWGAGHNNYSQLDPSPVDELDRPIQIATDVVSIGASENQTFYVTSSGILWARGRNDYGQLGNGTSVTRAAPVQVATDVATVEAGKKHTAFIKNDGSLWVMGSNEFGQLGGGNLQDSMTPIQVVDEGVVQVSVGNEHTLFLKEDNSLWAMGRNEKGQLADGSQLNPEVPRAIASGIVRMAAGRYHSLFLRADGALLSAGRNDHGQLGDGSLFDRGAPEVVANDVTAAWASEEHSLFLKSDGTLWGMGANASGQLNDGTTEARAIPVEVEVGVIEAAAGVGYTLFIKDDNSLWGVGRNTSGQLGDGTTTDRLTPVKIATDVVHVTAGAAHSAFIKEDDTLWMMGDNENGQLGDRVGGNFPSPRLIARDVQHVDAGYNSSVFVTWQKNLLGMGDVRTRTPGLSLGGVPLDQFLYVDLNVAKASLGDDHTLIILPDGAAQRWGGWREAYTSVFNEDEDFAGDALVVEAGGEFSLFLVAEPQGPGILTQPTSAPVQTGGSVTLSVEAFGSGDLSYQWYIGQSGDTSRPVDFAEQSTFSTPPLSSETVSYWVRVSNRGGHVDSDAAVVGVLSQPIIIAEPRDRTIPSEDTVSLSVTAQGGGLAYQWYEGESGDTSAPVSGGTSAALTTAPLSAPTRFWARIENGIGSVDSRTAVITVISPPQITEQPEGAMIGSGEAVTLSVLAESSIPLQYQWYIGHSGNVSNPIEGATQASYTTPLSLSTTYWVQVSNARGASDSLAASIRVDNGLSPVEEWEVLHFGEIGASGGPVADADGDGWSNLIEYALGLDPASNSLAGRPIVATSEGQLEITFQRVADLALIYGVEASTGSGDWKEIWSSTGSENTEGQVTVCSDRQMEEAAVELLRIRVSLRE